MALGQELRAFVRAGENDGAWARGSRGAPSCGTRGPAVWVASLSLNILGLGLPVVILQVYDRILPYQSLETFAFLILGLVFALFLDALLRTLRAEVMAWSAAGFDHVASCRAVERLLSAGARGLEKETSGQLLDRLSSITTLKDHYAGQAKLLLMDLPFVTLFLGLVYVIADWLVAVPIVVFLVLVLCALAVGRLLRQALESRAVLDDRRYSFVIEVLSGIQTVKLLAMEPQMQRRYERLQEATAGASYDVSLIANLAQGLGWFFSNLTMISVASLGAVAVMQGGLSIGGLAACTMLAGRSVQPLLRALGLWAQYQNIRIAEGRLGKLFDLAPEAPEAGQAVPALSGAMRVEAVSFGYDAASPPLIRDLSLDLTAGEVIGISGESGSGKSTLLLLLLGLLQPDSGRISADGTDTAGLDPYQFRRQIALLPQTATLFQGTIIENLTLFRARRRSTTRLQQRVSSAWTRRSGICPKATKPGSEAGPPWRSRLA